MHQKLSYIHLLKKSYLAYLQGKEEKGIVNHLVQMMPHGRILKCSESCDSKTFNNFHFVSINSMHYTKKTFFKKSKTLNHCLFLLQLHYLSFHLPMLRATYLLLFSFAFLFYFFFLSAFTPLSFTRPTMSSPMTGSFTTSTIRTLTRS